MQNDEFFYHIFANLKRFFTNLYFYSIINIYICIEIKSFKS